MDTIQVGIKSLSKSSMNDSWEMTFLTPVDNVEMTIALDKVGVGPRLREVLSILEQHQVYPRTITGIELERLGMVTADSFVVRFLVNVPAHVEVSFKTLRYFKDPSKPKVRGELRKNSYKPKSTLDANTLSINEITLGGGLPTKQNFKSTIVNTDYLITGTVAKIEDGDTIQFKVSRAGSKADDDDAIKEGAILKIRYVGMNTPETWEHYKTNVQDGNERNKEYCDKFNLSYNQAYSLGDKSWDKAKELLNPPAGSMIVLDMDADLAGMPKKDKYKRYVAALYIVDTTDEDEVFDGGYDVTVINKVMLGTMDTAPADTKENNRVPGNKNNDKEVKAPLAMPYYYFINNEYSRLPVQDWLYELGIRKESDKDLGDVIDDRKRKLDPIINTEPLEDGYTVHVKAPQTYNNQIDFMEPYDDRYDELFPDGLNHHVRIGDVMLVIPPLSIEVNRVSSIRKVKTLRSKSSMLIKGGSSATTLTLQLYFHDIDSINGREEKIHKDIDRHYYMDGLRPLIAQFKKAPFVPIDNLYINKTLGIDSVALVNLSVQTVPGFPHSLAANLVLAKFDHAAYMPQLPRLGDGINYPMFRWYYQEPMRDGVSQEEREKSFRTYLKPIPKTGLTNSFTWQMVDEEDLKLRKEAIQSIRMMTNPLVAEERFENPSTGITSGGDGKDANTLLGKEYKDAVAAQKVIDQHSRYMELKKAGRVSKKRDSSGYVPDDEKITVTHYNDDKWEDEFHYIYGDDKDDEDIVDVSHFAPWESWLQSQQKIQLEEKDGGLIKLRLYAEKNRDLFPKKYHKGKDGELYIVILPGTYISDLKKIVSRGKAAEETYVKGIEDWYKADAIIKRTEGKLRLQDYKIKGTLIPTNFSIIYENQFSNIQLQALDGPSFQFMGGQDPYIQVSFEADDLAVQSIREMLEETERYSREYRTGITSGFLGVKNHLMQLFGIDTIMPETVQFKTVPGFPGRYQIDMTLCGFDKTQKRTESLEGLSSIYGDKAPSRDTREAGNYKQAVDETVIEMKMANLELYPDLELPTYHELVTMLPYLNANCTVFENRTGGIYLDPDFYMATPQTYREFIRNEIENNSQMLKMNDFTGVEMVTSSKSTNPLDGDAAMWKVLNDVDSRTSQVPTNFSWSGNSGDQDGGTSNQEEITFKDKAIEEYVKDRKKVKEAPAEELWKTWGLDIYYRNYETWLKNAQPTEAQVYAKIYEMIDKLWVDQGLVYNDKNVDIENKAWQRVTYARYDDLWDAEWNKLASKHPKWVKKGQKKKHETSISSSDYKTTKSKVPRERIANIIKAVIHTRSKWQQLFASGMPRIDGQGNASGIMGVPISSEAPDIETAKRLLWDWRYNMEFGIRQLFESYQEALKEETLEYKCRPWEWMVAAYATGTIKGDLRNPFWDQVTTLMESRYNSYEQMYATPTTSMSLEIMQQRMGYTDHQMGVIEGNKDDLIEELIAMGYRTVTEKSGKDVKDNKEDTKKKLQKKDSIELRKMYDKYVKEHYDDKVDPDVVPRGPAIGEGGNGTVADGIAKARGKAKKALPDEIGDTIDAYTEVQQYIDNTINKRLVNQSDPQDIFPQMFIDMIEYDMRMRFVRAFPTFQMFIVDEGRWMTNYRLWDNLYGFNAIQSIDIHKNRKIAADTAVITMTNVYSNLTSRAMDSSYDEWDYKFWDNLVFGNPNEKVLESRKELLSSLMLETGARIHLRLGYGSSATNLPIVFNGTITEMNADEIVEIVCQGDGIELGNVISGDPNDDNKGWFHVEEPRDLLCELLTSKGNWFKDIINYETGGALFKDNPLGIMHFGQPTGEIVPDGTLDFFNENYGEAAQNIYSSNGTASFSQYSRPDGSDIPWSFDGTPVTRWLQPGDEDNIVVPFYNNTYWDIAQTLAYCSTDYIAQVHPFEMRSTMFFGKPYWLMAYRYDSKYEYNKSQKSWIRVREVEYRKPFSQVHLFDSYTDIIGNSIKASEEGIYTVVISNYDGKQVGPMYADFDIRFDKQKTTVTDAQIVSRIDGLDFWTSEKQAMYYGMSTLRDYIKDMYKGELLVLGDPTIKPHDICYMNDTMYDMNGNFMVKAVTHHFSQETGFVTSVQPDALTVNDDLAMLALGDWIGAAAAKAASFTLGFTLGAKALRKAVDSSVLGKAIKYGKSGATWATEQTLVNLAKTLPDGDDDVKLFKETIDLIRDKNLTDVERKAWISELEQQAKKLESKIADWEARGLFKNEIGKDLKGLKSMRSMKMTVKAISSASKALRGGPKALKYIKYASTILSVGGLVNPLSMIASLLTTWAVETIAEKYRRKKAMMQCVLVQPLQYQGRQYVAGINGRKGMVVGDAMGKVDAFLSGYGIDNNPDDENDGFTGTIMDAWNWLTEDPGKDYSITDEDLQNGNWKTSDKE